MKKIHPILFSALALALLLTLVACGATVNQLKPQQTITVDKSFQAQTSPVPTTPPYRCGAWSGNNAPGAYSVLTVYAKLTKNVIGVSGATATATVHFYGDDVTLDAQPTSDAGGYVTFTIPLQGRQPRQTPTTVDVTFNVGNQAIHCTPAFFTPV